MKTKPINKGQPKYTIYKYTVIQFEDEDEDEKLFECIPDRWFVDETKSQCYWPPRSGKPFSLRAINCEKPDIVTWSVHTCRVVSTGHLTYNDGLKLVREKCDQKYNTSSADEQINAALYRRQHPVLAMKNRGNIEHIFAKPTSEKQIQSKQSKSIKKSKENSTETNSTSCSILDDCSSTPKLSSSIVGSIDSSTIDIDNANFEGTESHKSDNDLSLDCGNDKILKSPVCIDGQTKATDTADITSKGSEVVKTDTASVRPSNKSRSSHPRSDGSRSSVSCSEGSRSSHIRSKERPKNDNDLSLDCGIDKILKSPMYVDGQTEATDTPEITPEVSEFLMTDSASVHRLNQSRSSVSSLEGSRSSHSRSKERPKSDNDLSLDCGNYKILKSPMYVDGQTEADTPEITPEKSEVLMTDSASVRPSNKSRSSHPRSDGSRSSVSCSEGSRSSHSRAKRSRSSHSCAKGSRSSYSRSSESCTNRSRSSSNRSKSSLSDSNRPRKDSRSYKSRQRRSDSNRRSRSIESSFSGSVRSFTKNPSSLNRSKKQNKDNSNSGLNKTGRTNTNSRVERTNNKPNETGRESNTNNKRSASRRHSNFPDSRSQAIQYISSRSRSTSRSKSSFRSYSRSRSPIRRETNNSQHRRQSEAGVNGQKMTSNNGKNKGRTSLGAKGNTLRYEAHSKQSISTHRRSSSRCSRSFFGSTQQSPKNKPKQPKNKTFHNPKSNREKNIHETSKRINSMADLWNVVEKMNETINENNQQLRDYDRRLNRMEVTLNKTFVLVGDLSGNSRPVHDELINDQGFEIPNLPIADLKELAVMKRKLRKREFRDFLLQHEKDFCCPTQRSTDTVTISKYLKRFISLEVRTEITLKESGENGITLFNDFHTVYLFLIDIMKAGYRLKNKSISNSDAHSALRIVWGRSKQSLREQRPRRKHRSRERRR